MNLADKYKKLEQRLKKVYGECEGLLETVVEHLERHEGIDLPEPVFKARLLTDGDVDKWEEYKKIGTVEEVREAREKRIPMKIVHNLEAGREADWTCPACKWTCSPYVRHCQNCGQALYNEEYGKD